MTRVRDLHKQWSQDPDYWAAYEALGPRFELARLPIEAPPDPPPSRRENNSVPLRSGGP